MKTRILLATLLAMQATACGYNADVGSNPGADAGATNLPEGTACTCVPGSCCASGLFCFAPQACNVQTDSGCYTEGRCTPKRALGQPCSDPQDCADSGAICAGPSGDPFTCKLPSPNCRARGEACGSYDQCCSGLCDGISFVPGTCR